MSITIQEKAKNIFDGYYRLVDSNYTEAATIETAKQCALICVDEIYLSLPDDENEPEHVYSDSQVYWIKVRAEIRDM